MSHLIRLASSLLLLASAASQAADNFAACPQFFANGKPPMLAQGFTNRALCYDSFAILHSGESKTPVFVAERLNQAVMAEPPQKRATRFFADARLRSSERATLEDYKGSGYDRGHMQFPVISILNA